MGNPDIEFYNGALVRVAKAAGIDDPMTLIAKARNNEQTYVDILVEHIASMTADAALGANVRRMPPGLHLYRARVGTYWQASIYDLKLRTFIVQAHRETPDATLDMALNDPLDDPLVSVTQMPVSESSS